jgi:signal transduction histidine kinase
MSTILSMKNWYEILSMISVLIPLFMGFLSFLYFKDHKLPQMAHLMEFYASLTLNASLVLAFGMGMEQMPWPVMLGWIWPLRTFKLFLEDLSGVQVFGRWHLIAIGVGAFLSFSLAGYGLRFLYFTMPFSFILGGVGIWATIVTWRRSNHLKVSSLQIVSYFLFSFYFFIKIFYPFSGRSFLGHYTFAAEIFFLVSLSCVGLTAFMELVTRKKEELLEQALQERSEKIIGQNKFTELGMMSAGIAHEINNPLAVIQARTSQLLRLYKQPDKQRELAQGLEQILYTSERIKKIIQGVREFVHQNEKASLSEVKLNELFDDVLAFTGQRMKNHGVNLRFYGLENLSVTCHKIQLEQVILNLLNNAFDAIEYLPDKWIEVSCVEKEGKIQIYFKDSGHGIPKEISARMMEPFFSTKDIGKGTGLGLALARGIVERHGGSLHYLDHCPHTTFLLELPRIRQDEWGIPMH